MDARTSNGQQKHQHSQHRSNDRPDPLAHVASRIASLSTEVGAMPLWSDLARQLREARFAVKFVTLYDFVGKCPRPVNGERDIALEFVRRHWEEKVIPQITNQRPAKDAEDAKKIALSLALRFTAHLRMAAMVSIEDFLAKRVEIERGYVEAGKEIPAEVLEQVAFTDRRSMYKMEELVAAGFKRSLAQEGLYKDPVTGAEVSTKPRSNHSDRRGRHTSRGNNEMFPFAGNGETREKKAVTEAERERGRRNSSPEVVAANIAKKKADALKRRGSSNKHATKPQDDKAAARRAKKAAVEAAKKQAQSGK